MSANFKGIARDSQGNTLDSASVLVYETGTTTQVLIYEEEGLSTLISQPLITSTNGAYNFWADYDDIDVTISKEGYSTYTIVNAQLGNLCDANYILDTVGATTDIITTVDNAMHFGILRIISGGATEDLDTANGWVLINPATWATGHTKDFDHPSNGRLRYTGSVTKEFRVEVKISLDTTITNVEYECGIGFNGADPAQWQAAASKGVANDLVFISSMAYVELDQNEYAEVFCRGSNAGADPVTILHAQLEAHNATLVAIP